MSLLNLEKNVSLDQYSWWKIGGKADFFVEVKSLEHLSDTICFLKNQRIPFCVIGRGTNLLFADKGFRGCVVRIGNGLSKCSIGGAHMQVEAGCWVPLVALTAAKSRLSGFEHAIGIPASIGGLICMNGGSQRKNIGNLIESVTVLDGDGNLRTDSRDELGLGYRKSRYQDSDDIIISTRLCFTKNRAYPEQRKEMLAILRDRNRKFPRKEPSCGSVFKSSPELYNAYGPPGKVIENLGYKGKLRGRIQVSPAHANFIVNLGQGSSADVLSLVCEIGTAVRDRFGLEMKPEFLYLHPTLGLQKVEY